MNYGAKHDINVKYEFVLIILKTRIYACISWSWRYRAGVVDSGCSHW